MTRRLVIVALALLALAPGGKRTPRMATVLYEQSWAAGSSTFCSPRVGPGGSVDYFECVGSLGSTSDEAKDALYPDVAKAEAVDVLTGGGPAGENVLDLSISGGGSDDYSTAGVWLHIPEVVAAGEFANFPVGAGVTATSRTVCIESWYKSSTQSLADNIYAPLIYINPGSSSYGSINLSLSKDGSLWYLELYSPIAGIANVATYNVPTVDILDTWVRYRIVLGVSSANGVADGYVQAYIGDTLVYDIQSIVVDRSGQRVVGAFPQTAPDYLIRDAYLGFAGLIGQQTGFRISDGGCDAATPTPPQVTGTMPSCCDPGNPAVGPDPVGSLPPWTASCTGGGVVDTVADLVEGEVW